MLLSKVVMVERTFTDNGHGEILLVTKSDFRRDLIEFQIDQLGSIWTESNSDTHGSRWLVQQLVHEANCLDWFRKHSAPCWLKHHALFCRRLIRLQEQENSPFVLISLLWRTPRVSITPLQEDFITANVQSWRMDENTNRPRAAAIYIAPFIATSPVRLSGVYSCVIVHRRTIQNSNGD